ncbi:MAG: hypothetical protein COY58_06440 [Gammaproteobacteria bacterium CG_4_10_14_0_8_um_filter_38_16]|nr:MAG: hypothetical protein COY58_06440 [Gammaproteobacteria bacterium CG_4_10_14_0_8_um_filter_38_16]PJA02628.1 MAG: hypothetical protein COX72_09280 [Gammaproteobacteria bacterium CG_4_10_14_0_2_um_filter_38_22]PJB11084.1 MAG: hypothetical protein CO120_01430 [Gammaproteobacteria bacterium CG_4_9_14_3_um_filter_38_9]
MAKKTREDIMRKNNTPSEQTKTRKAKKSSPQAREGAEKTAKNILPRKEAITELKRTLSETGFFRTGQAPKRPMSKQACGDGHYTSRVTSQNVSQAQSRMASQNASQAQSRTTTPQPEQSSFSKTSS